MPQNAYVLAQVREEHITICLFKSRSYNSGHNCVCVDSSQSRTRKLSAYSNAEVIIQATPASMLTQVRSAHIKLSAY